jgi:peptidoglycan/xylan/chitin deacetylase (PgdA/CDA1 family)
MLRQHAGPDLTFGAHTCSHRALPTLDPLELRTELERCADRVERELGARPRFLAYPYGAWSPAVRDAARRAGYTAALTLDAGRIAAAESDALALRRINVPGQISPAAFEAWASGLLPPRRRPAT